MKKPKGKHKSWRFWLTLAAASTVLANTVSSAPRNIADYYKNRMQTNATRYVQQVGPRYLAQLETCTDRSVTEEPRFRANIYSNMEGVATYSGSGISIHVDDLNVTLIESWERPLVDFLSNRYYIPTSVLEPDDPLKEEFIFLHEIDHQDHKTRLRGHYGDEYDSSHPLRYETYRYLTEGMAYVESVLCMEEKGGEKAKYARNKMNEINGYYDEIGQALRILVYSSKREEIIQFYLSAVYTEYNEYTVRYMIGSHFVQEIQTYLGERGYTWQEADKMILERPPTLEEIFFPERYIEYKLSDIPKRVLVLIPILSY